MIPILFFMLIFTNSIDLVTDEGELLDGFIYVGEEVITLDTWQTTLNPDRYFGYTEAGDAFYMLVQPDRVLIKIWQDNGTIRLIEDRG